MNNNLVPSYIDRGLMIERGEGAFLIDQKGDKYLDCMTGYGVGLFGHNNLKLINEITSQLKKIHVLHGSLNNPIRNHALELLTSILPDDLNKIYFTNSGAESIESALKFSTLITGRSKFIAAKNGYHGKTLGALGATSSNNHKYQKPFSNIINQFDLFEFNNINSLEQTITDQHAAVILEPIQCEGGIILPKPKFLKQVNEICKSKGVLLILDEIQTGLGRTGKMFCFEHYDIIPDILCLAKGIAGGIPAGIVVVNQDIASKIPVGLNTNTFGGNPLACAGIIATINELASSKSIAYTNNIARYLEKNLVKIKSDKIHSIRQKGLLVGIEMKRNAMPYIQKLQNLGIIVCPAGKKIIRLLPPLNIKSAEIDLLISALKKVILDN